MFHNIRERKAGGNTMAIEVQESMAKGRRVKHKNFPTFGHSSQDTKQDFFHQECERRMGGN